jgi:SSS family transporter
MVVETVTGVSLPICALTVGLLTIAYTFFGGIKSVIWNDCLQFLVYVAGGILALLVIVQRLPGGWEQLQAFSEATGKFRVWDGSFDLTTPYTFWAGLIGGAFLSLGTHGTDQMMVQRYLCARSQSQAGRAIVLSGVVVLFQFALFLVLGAAVACYYVEYPPVEPFLKTDRALSTFVIQELPAGVGLIGVILAAVFSAAMSTLSSSLNSSTSSFVNDLYLPCRAEPPSDRHVLWLSRAMTVCFGLVQIGIGILGMYLAEAVVNNVLAIASFTAGILLGVFALGVGTRRVGQRGALTGLVVGVSTLIYVKFGTEIAFTWYAAIGGCTTFVAGWVASLILESRRAGGRS